MNDMKKISVPLLLLPLLLAACATPGHKQPLPPLNLPAAFRHGDGWQRADTAVQSLAPSAPWWSAYGDPVLDQLMRDVAGANATLAQAEARHRQALSQIDAARAGARPGATTSVGATRSGGSQTATSRLYEAGLDIRWAPDLWGRVGQAASAAQAEAQAADADLAAVRLALQLTAAQGYVRLRTLDLQDGLLARTLQAYERSLLLTQRQYEGGLVARADVIQAETQLQALRAQRVATTRQRVLEEHALALLTGRTPAQLAIAADMAALPAVPDTPAQLPSALLVRRPDVAAAERQVAVANARLGAARSAWLPDLSLGVGGALQSGRWRDLFDAPVRIWSLGPTLAATLFDGGARRAEEARSLAVVDEQAQAWRATVLQAVRDTEDALASLRSLAELEAQQRRLVALAEENERVVNHRYEAGMITYLEVATAQTLALDSRRTALDVQAERLLASMQLIAALGGGWHASPPLGEPS